MIGRPLVAAAALASLVAAADAQSRPDFTGRWAISQAKSSVGATGNNATVTFPSELIAAHHGGELRVELHFPRTEQPVTAAYRLDGTEVPVGTPPGVTETARAAWDGATLVITARRVVASAFGDFVTDSREVWTLDADVLTIVRTQSSDGLSDTETAVFHRAR